MAKTNDNLTGSGNLDDLGDNLPVEHEDKPLIRDERGRFVKGTGGGGRKKGSKNRIKELQVQHELALREYMSDPDRQTMVLEGLDNIFRIMASGEDNVAVSAAKLVFDKLMPKNSGDSEGGSKGHGPIQIVIEAPSMEKPVPGIVIEPPE